ncbi:hypothetical protein ACRE_063670 [Hapsidospora chrysogenum ATCC 11550]|uniref:Ecp2 effector protein domain-containing protein n=1 Tax=Hapsidospora chrysogenum (strain ATCC 11550 / CBS 779.69 / DSM 880 / IAM 14645 / JCM 23072 / IMI 49137) TaxID=857340 RepID=A0A086T0L2_HAPC1|nr:hypothetical protein ACRE_063670 [Hapsidospora chrysogenum ATCC 11550]
MKSSLATLLLASFAAGFDVHQYPSKRCTGLLVSEHGVNANKGCVTARADGYMASLVNDWAEDADNNLVLALYSDENCCHANLVMTVDWEESCIEIETGKTVGSFRAVDPNNPDGDGGYDTCETQMDDDSVREVEGVPPTINW